MPYGFNDDKSKYDLNNIIETVDDLAENIAGNIATIETSPATANHVVGEYLVYNSVLHKVTSAIATGENLVVGTNIEVTSVGDELYNGLTLTQRTELVNREIASGSTTWRSIEGAIAKTYEQYIVSIGMAGANYTSIPISGDMLRLTPYATGFGGTDIVSGAYWNTDNICLVHLGYDSENDNIKYHFEAKTGIVNATLVIIGFN